MEEVRLMVTRGFGLYFSEPVKRKDDEEGTVSLRYDSVVGCRLPMIARSPGPLWYKGRNVTHMKPGTSRLSVVPNPQGGERLGSSGEQYNLPYILWMPP